MKNSLVYQLSHAHGLALVHDAAVAVGRVGGQMWQGFVRFMTESTTEPHIWTSRDHQGNLSWNGRDPLTGRRINHVSESELLAWLEQRYSM